MSKKRYFDLERIKMKELLDEIMQNAVKNGDTAGVNLLVLKDGREWF